MQSLWMLAASFLFALMAAFVKLANGEVGTFAFVLVRGVFGVALLAAWAAATGRTMRTRYPWEHAKRGIIGTIALSMWLFSLAWLPLSTGMTLNYTNPLFMAAIIVILAAARRQQVQWSLVLATVIGFAGVVVVLQPEVRSGDAVAAAVGLCSGLGSGLAYFQIRQLTDLKEPEYRVVFYFSVTNIIFGIAGMLLTAESFTLSARGLICILGVGTTSTVAQVVMTRAFGAGNMLLSSLLQFSGIVFAALIGIAFFGDPLTAAGAFGMAIIIASGTAASVITKRSSGSRAGTPVRLAK